MHFWTSFGIARFASLMLHMRLATSPLVECAQKGLSRRQRLTYASEGTFQSKTPSLIFEYVNNTDFRSLYPKFSDYDVRYYIFELLKVRLERLIHRARGVCGG